MRKSVERTARHLPAAGPKLGERAAQVGGEKSGPGEEAEGDRRGLEMDLAGETADRNEGGRERWPRHVPGKVEACCLG